MWKSVTKPGYKRLTPIIESLRSRKEPEEIDMMRTISQITASAFVATMRSVHAHEHKIHAEFDYQVRMHGLERMAFIPVVAGGANGLAIHYTKNTAPVNEGEMVLMDAGASLHGYNSDLCRTWPVNGRFSKEQRDIYEVVLQVQECIIAVSCATVWFLRCFAMLASTDM